MLVDGGGEADDLAAAIDGIVLHPQLFVGFVLVITEMGVKRKNYGDQRQMY